MAVYRSVTKNRILMGKLDFESDIIEQLTGVCKENNIKLGKVQAIGAVRKAKVGYYDQDTRTYNFMEFDKHLEITSLTGNISLKDGQPIIHAHINLSDENGGVTGGHLAPGTIAFAGEFIIEEYEGEDFSRGLDNDTGLPLWEM